MKDSWPRNLAGKGKGVGNLPEGFDQGRTRMRRSKIYNHIPWSDTVRGWDLWEWVQVACSATLFVFVWNIALATPRLNFKWNLLHLLPLTGIRFYQYVPSTCQCIFKSPRIRKHSHYKVVVGASAGLGYGPSWPALSIEPAGTWRYIYDIKSASEWALPPQIGLCLS